MDAAHAFYKRSLVQRGQITIDTMSMPIAPIATPAPILLIPSTPSPGGQKPGGQQALPEIEQSRCGGKPKVPDKLLPTNRIANELIPTPGIPETISTCYTIQHIIATTTRSILNLMKNISIKPASFGFFMMTHS